MASGGCAGAVGVSFAILPPRGYDPPMTKGSAVRFAATGGALMMGVAGCGVAAQETATPTLLRDVTATHVPPAPELHALDIALADVDGDGDLDAVLAVEG